MTCVHSGVSVADGVVRGVSRCVVLTGGDVVLAGLEVSEVADGLVVTFEAGFGVCDGVLGRAETVVRFGFGCEDGVTLAAGGVSFAVVDVGVGRWDLGFPSGVAEALVTGVADDFGVEVGSADAGPKRRTVSVNASAAKSITTRKTRRFIALSFSCCSANHLARWMLLHDSTRGSYRK